MRRVLFGVVLLWAAPASAINDVIGADVPEICGPGGCTVAGTYTFGSGSRLHLNADILASFGGSAASPQFWCEYDSSTAPDEWACYSTDVDGAGTNGKVFSVPNGTSQFVLGAGSAAAPSLAISDAGGFYRAAASMLGVTVAGAGYASFGSGANVGSYRFVGNGRLDLGTSGECSINRGILSCFSNSAVVAVRAQQDNAAARAAEVSGNADTGEIATRIGTSVADAANGDDADALASFCTDCDGTPSEKAAIMGNGAFRQTGVTFANLGTPGNGVWIYCSDCTKATPCADSGTGALAKRINGAWDCD